MRYMAGHSKWAKIARSKGAADAARSVVFSKMSMAISAAARSGGTDLVSNLRLAAAVERAKASNVPKDVIERAIAKGSDTTSMEEFVVEGMGPGGTAVVVEALTSNKKKTMINIKYVFKQYACEVGAVVAFMFESRGRVTVPFPDPAGADALMEAAVAAGGEDVDFDDDDKVAYVWADAATVQSVRKALNDAGVTTTATEVLRFPTSTVDVPPDAEEALVNMLADLEANEDVQAVYHNAAE